MPASLENPAVTTGLGKVSFDSNPKECWNYHTITLISHTSKVMLKILQVKLQQHENLICSSYNNYKEKKIAEFSLNEYI